MSIYLKTEGGLMDIDSIPVIKLETKRKRDIRMFYSLGFFIVILLYIIFTYYKQSKNTKKIDSKNLVSSFSNKSKGIIGDSIQVYSYLNDLEINDIIPYFKKIKKSGFGNIGSLKNSNKYKFSKLYTNKGSIYELKLNDSNLINKIEIISDDKNKKLETTKVIIREEGIKKWQSPNFLKNEKRNVLIL